ncbi:hypothetical protein JHD48_05700 [Sulfurimonas sp. SAG-AH-194-I05]|nr:ion transporter [Sulfurimonas sp. SAG-AH-194-I05]MDF1875219.1 hypothetical protein [Sulfurimonas sp. SAG-AH-194-I05]
MLQTLYKVLEQPRRSSYGNKVQNLIFANIIINIFVSFVGDIFILSDAMAVVFHYVEYATVIIFTVELLLRYIIIGIDEKYRGVKGRLLYTFTPFILIDIITLLPYLLVGIGEGVMIARLLRLLRFFRLLKLLRLKDTLKRFFSVSMFATSPITLQIFILFVFSIVFINLFSFVYSGGNDVSLMIFLDPPALAEASSLKEMLFGIVELLVGLLIGGALISIITELLSSITSNVKNGYYPYKGTGHIVIINYNSKLEFILQELDYYHTEYEQKQAVVLFLPFVKEIEAFSKNLKKYHNIELSILTGDSLNWQSYKRININHASKVLLLEDKQCEIKNLNTKIARFIVSNEKYTNDTLAFTIESTNDKVMKHVYAEIFRENDDYSLIEHNDIIQKILNRSIVEPAYFKIYTTLMSYEDYEFYRLEASEVFENELSFGEAYMQFSKGVLVGLRKDGILLLNPPKATLIAQDDKLVMLMQNTQDYELLFQEVELSKAIDIKKPRLKIKRKICIVGDYEEIKEENITQFLEDESIADFQRYVLSNSEYMESSFWDTIVSENYDTIILNMEDDFEFILTMYLKNLYSENSSFLSRIINIIHNPINAKLLEDKKNNIILSEKIVGEYITQIIFNRGVVDIFNEITHSRGNEFYLLNKEEYRELFALEYLALKADLLHNEMLYIGVMRNDTFVVDCRDPSTSEQIVVLAQGE